jgi:hypothetical protein
LAVLFLLACLAVIVLPENPVGSRDIGRIKIVLFLPKPVGYDKTPSWAVVPEKTKLEALEFPEIAASLAETLKVLPVRNIAFIGETLKEGGHLPAVSLWQRIEELKRWPASAAIDGPLYGKPLSFGRDGLDLRHEGVYLYLNPVSRAEVWREAILEV